MSENRDLRFENQQLVNRISSLNDTERENETLREVLNFSIEKDFELLFAQIVLKDITKDSLLINKGLKDGIRKGFPAITSQKVLLGRVGEVYNNFSEVILVSNKESSFDAKVSRVEGKEVEEINLLSSPALRDADGKEDLSSLTSTLRSTRVKEVYGVVKGEGGLKIYLDLIPKEDEILENDIVVTAALGGIFPQGFLVGKAKSIKISDLEPFQRVELEPSFLLKDLDKIFIITNFK